MCEYSPSAASTSDAAEGVGNGGAVGSIGAHSRGEDAVSGRRAASVASDRCVESAVVGERESGGDRGRAAESGWVGGGAVGGVRLSTGEEDREQCAAVGGRRGGGGGGTVDIPLADGGAAKFACCDPAAQRAEYPHAWRRRARLAPEHGAQGAHRSDVQGAGILESSAGRRRPPAVQGARVQRPGAGQRTQRGVTARSRVDSRAGTSNH